jgi:hypothetical protein
MLSRLRLAGQIARYIILAIALVRQLVVEAEETFDGRGRGAEKFAAVLAGLRAAAQYVGIGVQAIDVAERFVGEHIETAVTEEINEGTAE